MEIRAMGEHDDDLEAEVEEGAEFEVQEFLMPDEDDEERVSDDEDTPEMEQDTDPDESEI
jgi:hypothetical protein